MKPILLGPFDSANLRPLNLCTLYFFTDLDNFTFKLLMYFNVIP